MCSHFGTLNSCQVKKPNIVVNVVRNIDTMFPQILREGCTKASLRFSKLNVQIFKVITSLESAQTIFTSGICYRKDIKCLFVELAVVVCQVFFFRGIETCHLRLVIFPTK